jgi:flavin reductase (DIM6/NTAB) family NADH-FMN oxidoreductase RutF
MKLKKDKVVELDISQPFFRNFFTIAPLIVVGTKEGDHYNVATKHMAMPMGDNYFGFICTPKHSTYHNIIEEKEFTISFPRPDQVILASLAAMPRCEEIQHKQALIDQIPTFKAKHVDGLFIRNAYLFFECSLHKIVDDFGDFSLISGKILHAYVQSDSYRASEKDEQKMVFKSPMLAYLAPGRFAKIKKSYSFPFPKNFQHLIK